MEVLKAEKKHISNGISVPKSHSLDILDRGLRMLAEARTMTDLRRIRNLAVAAAALAKAEKLGIEAIRQAVKISGRASYRMAELDEEKINKGGRGKKAFPDGNGFSRLVRHKNRDLLALCSEDEIDVVVDGMKPAAISLSRLRRIARDRKAQDRPKAARVQLPQNCDIRLGDFRQVLADISDQSIDVILTDPPYPAEFLPLWTDLALFAKRVLRKDGVLLAMSGQFHLPEVISRLSEHLTYRWVIAYVTAGPGTVVHAAKVQSMWKPVLVYGSKSQRMGDLASSPSPEKSNHKWGQSDVGLESILRLVAEPGMTVCDPFVGAGSSAVAALKLGCSFIGAEIDEKHYENATGRIV